MAREATADDVVCTAESAVVREATADDVVWTSGLWATAGSLGSRLAIDPDGLPGTLPWASWSTAAPPKSVAAGTPVSKYWMRFRWTAQHRTSEQLEPLRLEGDAPMDEVLRETGIGDAEDVLEAIGHAPPGSAAARLREQVVTPPAWLDEELLARGQGTRRASNADTTSSPTALAPAPTSAVLWQASSRASSRSSTSSSSTAPSSEGSRPPRSPR